MQNLFEDIAIKIKLVMDEYKELEEQADEIGAGAHIANDFPRVFTGVAPQEMQERQKEAIEYIVAFLKEYIQLFNILPEKIDNIKILYAFGMYIFEKFNSYHGIVIFLTKAVNEIEASQRQNITIDPVMNQKVAKIAKMGQKYFFRYYGEFGIYHTLEHLYRTLR